MPAERFSEMVRCSSQLLRNLTDLPQSASPASGVPTITMKSFAQFLTRIEKVRDSFWTPSFQIECKPAFRSSLPRTFSHPLS